MNKTASFVDTAINANRDNFILKTSAWAEADPLFSVKHFNGATAVFSGSSTDTFNVLALARDTERTAFDIIEEARAAFFGDNRFAVWSWQDGQLQSLPVDNTAIEENLIMACDAEDLTKKAGKTTSFETTKVTEIQHMMDTGSVLASIFGESEEAFMIQSLYAGQDKAGLARLPIKYLLAYEGGRPVSAGSYIVHEKTAGIYDICVRPEDQKKGTGSRMFDAVVADARKAGATSFTLQASADGADIYTRAGFETLGACWCLDIS